MNRILALFSALLFALVSLAQTTNAGDAPYYSVNPYDYRYDMSLYAVVKNFLPAYYEVYEVAAFVGDECRGTLTYSPDGYGYMRIYSNSASGENVTFRIYNKVTKKPLRSATTLAFTSDNQEGMPSSPFVIVGAVPFLKGDINADGVLTIVDLVNLIDRINADAPYSSICDMDGDGEVDKSDVISLANQLTK